MLKKVLVGAAAAAALMTPAVALADTSGHVGFSYSSLDDDDDGDKEAAMGLDGSLVTGIGGSWNMQFDGAQRLFEHGDHDHGYGQATAHVFHRDGSWAFGGFAGLNDNDGDTMYHVGAEGQFYLSNWTFSGAYTFADMRNDGSGPEEIDAIDLGADFFLTPNTSFGADFTWLDDGNEEEDGTVYAVNVEHQFAGSPFSLGAHYTLGEFDYAGGGGGHDTTAIGVFARYNFGTADLRERSQQGASMTGAGTLNRNSILNW